MINSFFNQQSTDIFGVNSQNNNAISNINACLSNILQQAVNNQQMSVDDAKFMFQQASSNMKDILKYIDNERNIQGRIAAADVDWLNGTRKYCADLYKALIGRQQAHAANITSGYSGGSPNTIQQCFTQQQQPVQQTQSVSSEVESPTYNTKLEPALDENFRLGYEPDNSVVTLKDSEGTPFIEIEHQGLLRDSTAKFTDVRFSLSNLFFPQLSVPTALKRFIGMEHGLCIEDRYVLALSFDVLTIKEIPFKEYNNIPQLTGTSLNEATSSITNFIARLSDYSRNHADSIDSLITYLFNTLSKRYLRATLNEGKNITLPVSIDRIEDIYDMLNPKFAAHYDTLTTHVEYRSLVVRLFYQAVSMVFDSKTPQGFYFNKDVIPFIKGSDDFVICKDGYYDQTCDSKSEEFLNLVNKKYTVFKIPFNIVYCNIDPGDLFKRLEDGTSLQINHGKIYHPIVFFLLGILGKQQAPYWSFKFPGDNRLIRHGSTIDGVPFLFMD